jgi:integrase/recombinase XerD
MRLIERRCRRIPEVLTAEEQEGLFSQLDQNRLVDLRNLCMLKLMMDNGLRISEAIHLQVRDVDWNNGSFVVRQGKGNRDRILYLNDENLALLKRWKEARPIQCSLLFTTLQGHPVYDVYIRQVMKRITKKAHIDKNVHPHTLRHSFATDLYRYSKDIMLVQKALGHSDISTTMIYTHLVDDDLEDALRNFRKGKTSIKMAS